mmetsp:Transcript_22045/g.26888  ORF Transcript_22045/g.26888 Transcript_22045/m.26888 type:complete len:194 (-) Transcript_22045:121-702(-)
MVILRDPVRRLHSSYWHFCSINHMKSCTARGFRNWVGTVLQDAHQGIQKRNTLVDGNAARSVAYGLYANYLEKWFEVFKEPGRFLVLFTEAFQESPFDTMRRIEEYYGLTRFDFKNVATQVNGYWVLGSSSKAIKEAKKPPGYSKLKEDKEMEDALYELYRDSINRLRELLLQKNRSSSVPVIVQDFPKWLQP